ncbi:pyridoxamine 5'-phosphate oxidase family protein [Leptolyngbya sp. FACHB-261]|uniref:pyridoxamine 5'-phosphate oxidase family protein n=1 Tax=Leptolyngbya sp. FACHB-261 TaxID=2692806 RepID=UPI0016898F71|nr:pyridoxamine 5'-phosphate oxidase family protein [Leptolyngbya sp. FACHB-261]MBD2103274.1 pyridoxamine 5'-phosphate oxidase family protein [Leptolyngbya sp. FACHB-261]
MAKFYPKLNETLRGFIGQQKIFFTASAADQGRVNLSPKGVDTLRCLSDEAVAYLDLTGSGNETAAHLLENGRLTIMFCSFTEKPLILRLYGQGQVIRPRHQNWPELHAHFHNCPGERQIILLNIESVQTSCGAGVPLYEYQGERQTIIEWAEKKGEEGLSKYWHEKNQVSIDGLPTKLLAD